MIFMVLACKVFEVVEKMGLNLMARKLKDYTRTFLERVDDREFELGSRVTDLSLGDDVLKGVFEESFLIETRYRDRLTKIPISLESPFLFIEHQDRMFLALADKKDRANRIASTLSEALTAKRGAIIEGFISHEILKSLHESNPNATKVIFFDNVRLPNLDKLSLYGSSVADTALYSEYLKIGRIWYVVFRARENLVIGLTRNCVIPVFSKIDLYQLFDYVKEEIIPLLLEAEHES